MTTVSRGSERITCGQGQLTVQADLAEARANARMSLALAIAQLAHDKVAHEQATIQDILHGRYSSAWVGVALKQKGF